jgi:hypothetical protein
MIGKFKVRRSGFIARGCRSGCTLGIEPCEIIFPIQFRHCPAPSRQLRAARKDNIYNSLGDGDNNNQS